MTISTSTADGFTPDTILALFDNQGNLLSFDDDGGLEGNFKSLLAFTASEPGNYFVAVSQYPNFPTGEGDFAHGGPEYGFTDPWTGPGPYDLSILIA